MTNSRLVFRGEFTDREGNSTIFKNLSSYVRIEIYQQTCSYANITKANVWYNLTFYLVNHYNPP
jgi:hypothetical protein